MKTPISSFTDKDSLKSICFKDVSVGGKFANLANGQVTVFTKTSNYFGYPYKEIGGQPIKPGNYTPPISNAICGNSEFSFDSEEIVLFVVG